MTIAKIQNTLDMEKPPVIKEKEYLKAIRLSNRPEIAELVERLNQEYAYWDKVKYQKLPEGINHEELWACIKFSRLRKSYTWESFNSTLHITNNMNRQCHEMDMHFGGDLGSSNACIPNEHREKYLINSLMEEAISSSQMEGASTTRKLAKDMLRKEQSPKSRSEQMIYNNYRTIRYIVDNKSQELTPQILLNIHHMMTEKTLGNPEEEGALRTNDDIVVANGITNEIVHRPPSHEGLATHIADLCDFFNKKNELVFIHPIIRAILIHYMVAYLHPFTDGNGRTARTLFYWYMIKEGYWLTEYLSISKIIYDKKTSYEKAYIQVANDQRDMGYFVSYHLNVLEQSFKKFIDYLERKKAQQSATQYHKIGNLNERQADIIRLVHENGKLMLTIKEVQNRYGVSHTTAKSDLAGLINTYLLEEIALNKVKKGYIKGGKFDEIVESI